VRRKITTQPARLSIPSEYSCQEGPGARAEERTEKSADVGNVVIADPQSKEGAQASGEDGGDQSMG
jgi:hypothetical protein